jgi:L-histidine Nalpha-methyltransferase
MQPSAARPKPAPLASAEATPGKPAPIDSLAGDVQYYLTLAPRQLPSRYLYDALGSALFEAICELPWYGITRAERRLLSRHGHDILAQASPTTLVELGPGSGDKLGALIAARGRRSPDMMVHLVDVSAAALEHATRTLITLEPELSIVSHETTYENGLVEAMAARAAGLPRTESRDGRAMVLFLGSNLGNFDSPGADEFLLGVRAALAIGDTVLIGADLVKPERPLLLAYDDPLGVTGAFNRNLLVRINRELGADFDVSAFSHRAIWNAEASRVEMHLVATRQQQVRIPGAALEVTFEAGETIWTESSYKYRPAQIVEILGRAGLSRVDQWIDQDAGFALTLAEATSLPAEAD